MDAEVRNGHGSRTLVQPWCQVFCRDRGEGDGRSGSKSRCTPNSILGDEDDLVEGMLLGTIDMAVAATAKLSSFVPEADLFSLPFLFRDYDHWAKVLDGPQGARMKEIIESKSDLILLGYWGCGTRMLFNSQKPVVTPDDLRGLKIRTMPGPVDIQTWEDLGAIPTPVAWPELYSALKQGVVDGAENDPANIIQQKFYEPCPYISLTDHRDRCPALPPVQAYLG